MEDHLDDPTRRCDGWEFLYPLVIRMRCIMSFRFAESGAPEHSLPFGRV